MTARDRFPERVLAALHGGKILGLRAGTRPHRFIGLWVVVVSRRVFVRSWSVRTDGWYHAFLDEPVGTLQIGTRKIPVRAVRTRSERLKAAVDQAYRTKYRTPGAIRYVRDLTGTTSRNTTIELVPR